jgi:tRNA (mo5U34)-methyltransferase
MTDDLRARVAELEWYHTMDLPGGVTTPGFFDHRGILPKYGFPARLDGKRVLDVGTFDGFFGFELERRGAEVVSLDVPDAASLDFPAHLRRTGLTRFQPRHVNFDLAREALGSKVDRRFVSVYDASPEALGTFDLVFIGSVLIHLRDPVGALMALRTVVNDGGEIMICEEIRRWLDLVGRKTPIAKLQAMSPHLTWWIGNRACWEHMLRAAGFVDVRHGATFTIPYRGARGGIRHGMLTARQPGDA